MPSPLVDTLFRPTAEPRPATEPRQADDHSADEPHSGAASVDPDPSAALASALPVRESGLRSRGGNAMSRTRQALLAGAAQAVLARGTRITMAQVAAAAGVAKATLYNHFRTREAVLDALVDAEVRGLIGQLQSLSLPDALAAAGAALSVHPVLRAVVDSEPQTAVALAAVRPTGRWALVEAVVAQRLAAEGRGGAQLVVRWLASFVITPAELDAIRADVAALLAGLPAAPAVSATA